MPEEQALARMRNDSSLILWRHKETAMPKFVIEREMPGAGTLSSAEFTAMSQRSCSVLRLMGPTIQWLESFVTDDRIYCLYRAPNEAVIREHAAAGGLPVSRISAVRRTIDPENTG
jgi:hypothetical protein